MFGGYNSIYYEVIASQTSTNCNRLTWCDVVNVKYFCHIPVLPVTLFLKKNSFFLVVWVILCSSIEGFVVRNCRFFHTFENNILVTVKNWLTLTYGQAYITDLVYYTNFHWFFNPECQHIFGKQTGYIFQSPKNDKNMDDKALRFTESMA